MFQRAYHLTIFIVVLLLTSANYGYAHPTGNVVTFGNSVYWSYIDPIDDESHTACIMVWDKQSEPSVFLKSEHPASDYMLFSDENNMYIIERRHVAARDIFDVRLLKMTSNSKPTVIWDWFKDDWRIGEAGFFMLSDTQLVFAKYPNILILNKDSKPTKYLSFDEPVDKIRLVENGNVLVLASGTCYLLDNRGEIVMSWVGMLDDQITDAPLNRNQIFDIDYRSGALMYAYWGKRSFELMDANGTQKVLLQLKEPLAPHWIASSGDDMYLFASELVFDGSTPKPYFVRISDTGKMKVIWDMRD